MDKSISISIKIGALFVALSNELTGLTYVFYGSSLKFSAFLLYINMTPVTCFGFDVSSLKNSYACMVPIFCSVFFFDLIYTCHFLVWISGYIMLVLGWSVGVSISLSLFLGGDRLQFYCWYGDWSMLMKCFFSCYLIVFSIYYALNSGCFCCYSLMVFFSFW